jgi:2-(1,2-epoxy-1,2-dihydrophenyl)acetyl-CoA isomerase
VANICAILCQIISFKQNKLLCIKIDHMSYSSVLFSIADSVATIKLNRPDVLNSFNKHMALELQQALKECEENKEIRAVLLTGEGRGFCAGQDLAEAIATDAPPIREIVRTYYNPIISLIRNIEKPVICAVNGVAAGAGANLAFACDIILASSSASFIQSFSKIGLIPDSGGTFFLPRLIGIHRATALMFTGDKITAEQALSLGLVYKVFEQESLFTEATSTAKQLAAMPTKGLGLTKRALNRSLSNDLQEQLQVEEELQDEAGKSYDFNEGVKAFIEKRKPVFKGE